MRSLEPSDLVNWLLSKLRVSETSGNVRELLILGPLNIVLGSFVMIVVIRGWSVSESLLELKLNLKLGPGWLPPPMVVLEEHVV